MAFADWGALGAFVSVVVIDVVLAGDNAIVVGLATALVPREMRRTVMLVGIGAAAVLRILLALVAVDMLAIVGLTLAGGLLLLWVAWKLYRELASAPGQRGHAAAPPRRHSVASAALRIVIADLSMSLDNVLAVAGAARNHLWVLAAGLILSVALMAAAAQLLAALLERHRWIAWLGLAIVTVVALRMIYDGSLQIAAAS